MPTYNTTALTQFFKRCAAWWSVHIASSEKTAPRIILALSVAVTLGVTYGIAVRLRFAEELMTAGFIFCMPIVLGFLTVWASPLRLAGQWWYAVFVPWLTVACLTCVVLVVHLEGVICAVLAFPIFGFMASLGGLIVWGVRKVYGQGVSGAATNGTMQKNTFRQNSFVLVSVLLMPFLVIPAEQGLEIDNNTVRTVQSAIVISAPTERVWQNIIRVRTIAPEEQTLSFFHHIGFPKPLDATLSFEGVGGVRHARFERGVVFTETITAWEHGKLLRFAIRANTEDIPSSTLDEHVQIGGKYFDVLTGTYRIEELDNGSVRLHLVSEQRLSTNINLYAGIWTDAIMHDIQTNILRVIQRRCENPAARD